MKLAKNISYYFLGFVAILIVVFFIGVLWPLPKIVPANTTSPVFIENASVLDLYAGKYEQNQSILIHQNKIIFTGNAKNVKVPPNALRINGEDKYLIPALWDMHTHSFKMSPLLDQPLHIAFGVTNIRDMMSCPKENDPFAPCPEDLRAWSQAAIQGEIVAPRIQSIVSWQTNGPGVHDYISGLPEFYGTATPEQAREFVRHYAEKVDAIKVYNFISKQSYFALADEAKKLGLDLVGHRPRSVSAIDAAKNQKSIEHARFIIHESFPGSGALRNAVAQGKWNEDRRRMLDEHSEEMAEEIFEAMKDHGTYYVPTHLTRREDAYADDPIVREDPILEFVHPLIKWQWLEDVNKTLSRDPSPEARQTYRDFYEKGLELTGQAHKAGVKVLAGTDYLTTGITLHNELEQLTLAGLSPLDAIRAATIVPVEYYGLQAKFGAIKAGMTADILILDKNPIEDIRNTAAINTVIYNGNVYDTRQLNDIKNAVIKRANSWSVGCKILWMFIKNPTNY